jgi:hypothetical protein
VWSNSFNYNLFYLKLCFFKKLFSLSFFLLNFFLNFFCCFFFQVLLLILFDSCGRAESHCTVSLWLVLIFVDAKVKKTSRPPHLFNTSTRWEGYSFWFSTGSIPKVVGSFEQRCLFSVWLVVRLFTGNSFSFR